MSISVCSLRLSGNVSTGLVDRFGVLVVSLKALQLVLVDQNPLWPCLRCILVV